MKWKWKSLSCVRLFATHGLCSPWNSPGQNTGVGSPFPSPGDLPNPGIEPRSSSLQADSLPAEPQEKLKNTEVGSLSCHQWILPTQEWNQGLLHCRQILYQLSYQGSPTSGDGELLTPSQGYFHTPIPFTKNWDYYIYTLGFPCQ